MRNPLHSWLCKRGWHKYPYWDQGWVQVDDDSDTGWHWERPCMRCDHVELEEDTDDA